MGLLSIYNLHRRHGALSKNTNSNPDLLTLKLKKTTTKTPQKPQTTVGLNRQTPNSSTPNYREFQTWIQAGSCMCIHRVSYLQQLQASGARRCPTFHVQSPTFSVGSLPLDSLLWSLYISVVFLQVMTVGQLM